VRKIKEYNFEARKQIACQNKYMYYRSIQRDDRMMAECIQSFNHDDRALKHPGFKRVNIIENIEDALIRE
jgi:hypothetical protein